MNIQDVLQKAVEQKVSDIFIIAGAPISFKIGDVIRPYSEEKMMPEDTADAAKQIYELDHRDISSLYASGDDDFSFSIKHLSRFRCNAYKQRGSLAMILRVVSFELPDYSTLGIPDTVIDLYRKNKGLVLITGSAGSGKSTTLSCIIDKINKNRNSHIITIEDPIEYLHRHDKSLVSQRELGHDTKSYVSALRAALRQAPNVILLGEMRDYETIMTAMTAAETGQLVLSTLHTIGAANTIDRIIDVFPANQQQQIRVQLSMVLQAVVSQQLIPAVDGGLVPAFEIMLVNRSIRIMIRVSIVHQIYNVIFSSQSMGMRSMDADILRLYQAGRISRENALLYSVNSESMRGKLV